ncbi:MAG: GntR family transcriptional regulator [Chloroflexi bacterium]|nr:GntR family transcriptional regulator [Chloroflexota bacterium]
MVENSIRDLIITGGASPGDRLPAEKDLSR